MLAKVAGSNQFKIGQGDKTWNELEYVASIAFGSGLALDADGQIVVDFSQMPTDKFEALVKSIRVPIWLTKNTNFYVDGATGSDVISSGRGLSADMAFKTIQACVNYVCDNYNLSRYNVTINVENKAVYYENLKLQSFQGSGAIILQSAKNGTLDKTKRTKIYWDKVDTTEQGSCVITNSSNNIYYVYYFELCYYVKSVSTSRKNVAVILCYNKGSITNLMSCKLYFNFDDYEILNDANVTISAKFIKIFSNATCILWPGELEWEIESTNEWNVQKLTLTCFICGRNAELDFTYSNNSSGLIKKDFVVKIQKMYTFVNSAGGDVLVSAAPSNYAGFTFTIPEDYSQPIGTKFTCVSGGHIDVSGKGQNIFPGTAAGTIDEGTYSWYK